jgi:GTP cyclohydrolase I
MHNGNGKAELAEFAVAPAIAAGSALGVQSGVMPFSTREPLKPADNLQAIIKLLLSELGVDVDSQHFKDTPARVARFFREYTRGYRLRPEQILKTFNSRNKGLIVVSGIDFFSLCPHHLLVYGGKVYFGYIPDGQIVGISKIPRLAQGLAARMVVQEDLVADIADAFMSVVKPLGCAVRATGKHDCVAARGVRCPEATMTTLALRGVFEEKPKLVEEFHHSITQAGTCIR